MDVRAALFLFLQMKTAPNTGPFFLPQRKGEDAQSQTLVLRMTTRPQPSTKRVLVIVQAGP